MAEQFQIDFTKIPSPLAGECEGEGYLTRDERGILSLLKSGRENAIGVKALANVMRLSGVEVRQIVKHLVEEHSILIVSSTGKPCGYYYPDNEIEYKAGVNQLIHRIRSLAKRIKAMDKEAYEQIFGQMNMVEDLKDMV